MGRARNWLLGACAALGAGLAASAGAQESAIAAFNYAPLTPPALRAHIEVLASDGFEGRAPASRGEALTVDYIARAFALAGLEPGGDARGRGRRGWRQRVPMLAATVANRPVLTVGVRGDARPLAYGDEYLAWSLRPDASARLDRAELVFVGYGVVSPQLGRDDYAGVAMAGKVALILANDPDFETGDDRGFRGRASSRFGAYAYKVAEAARQGAAGALVVHEQSAVGYPWAALRASARTQLALGGSAGAHPPVEGWLRQDAAESLLARAGADFATEKARAQRPDFTPRPLGLGASLTLDMRYAETASNNVVGVLRGTTHADEAIVYTAHWDHLGRCAAGSADAICNGALDNASGVAGLIEMGRRFVNTSRSQRSVVFVATAAQEDGLLGARYFVRHSEFAPARMAAAINLDMLAVAGPARDISIIGEGRNDLETLLAEAARAHDRRVSADAFPALGGYYRSDHLAFAEAGVPALFAAPGLDLYNGGTRRGQAIANNYLAERYHRPSDQMTADWDLTGAFQDLLLLFETGERLADSREWPQWRGDAEFGAIREPTANARAEP